MKKLGITKLNFKGSSSVGNSSSYAYLSEQELSAWAERSAIASNNGSRFVGLGALAFWAVVAAILIARFFIIDPAKLRPTAAATPFVILSEAQFKS